MSIWESAKLMKGKPSLVAVLGLMAKSNNVTLQHILDLKCEKKSSRN